MDTYYTKRVASGSWSGWALVRRGDPQVVILAATRDDIEKLSRRHVKAARGYLKLRDSRGRYYDNVDYR